MKNNLLILFISFSILLTGQDIIISFSATGAATSIETVEVTNLSNCTSITLDGDEVLNLTEGSIGIAELSGTNKELKVYPNPFYDINTINVKIDKTENILIRVIDIKGKLITELKKDWYTSIIETEIAPLLKEYWFDNAKKADEAIKRLLD